MNAHNRKTYEALTEGRAPRALEWTQFVSLWEELADDVAFESGDRLVVHLNGSRVIFRRQHNGLVSIDDIERARRLLASTPPEHDTGQILVVAIDDQHARIITYQCGEGPTVVEQSRTIHNTEPTARRLRTVERRHGRDDVHDLTCFFDEVATALTPHPDVPLVILGAGHGKSAAAQSFVQRLRTHHQTLAAQLSAIGDVDLSSAADTDVEVAALAALRSA